MARGIPFFERGTQRLPPWKFETANEEEEEVKGSGPAEATELAASIVDELLRSTSGRDFADLARSVGYTAASLTIELPAEVLEHVVEEVTRRLRDEMTVAAKQETLDTKEAADFLRTSEQRIYDLVSQRKLRPEFKDGKKNIFQRKELEAYLRGKGTRDGKQ